MLVGSGFVATVFLSTRITLALVIILFVLWLGCATPDVCTQSPCHAQSLTGQELQTDPSFVREMRYGTPLRPYWRRGVGCSVRALLGVPPTPYV